MPQETLWTGFNNQGLFAERARKDVTGRDIATALDNSVNVIESVSVNGAALSPDVNKNVDIPLASASSGTYTDGLMTGQEKEKLSALPSSQLTLAGDGTYITATEASGTVTVALVATTGSYTMIQ